MASEDDIRREYATLLTSPDGATVRKTLEALSVDVHSVLAVMRSEEGARQFKDAVHAVEGASRACGRVRNTRQRYRR